MNRYYFYRLHYKEDTFYVGVTTNPSKRLMAHRSFWYGVSMDVLSEGIFDDIKTILLQEAKYIVSYLKSGCALKNKNIGFTKISCLTQEQLYNLDIFPIPGRSYKLRKVKTFNS